MRPVRKADNLTTICEPTVYKIWEPRRPTPLWASTACYSDRWVIKACNPPKVNNVSENMSSLYSERKLNRSRN
jgi:hypothetical protein